MDVTVPGNAAQPEDVARAIMKALFRDGLPTDKEFLGRQAITGALTKWGQQLLKKAAIEVEKAKAEARDQMMRADEALLRLASMQVERGEKVD